MQIDQSESRKSKAAHRSIVNIVSCFALYLNCTVFRYSVGDAKQNLSCEFAFGPKTENNRNGGWIAFKKTPV